VVIGESIATDLGLSHDHYYRLERGTHAPSYPTAVKLAAWLGWTTDQVMEAAGRPAPSAEGCTDDQP
jgi:DNA-binding XRE family transcriptional regulator